MADLQSYYSFSAPLTGEKIAELLLFLYNNMQTLKSQPDTIANLSTKVDNYGALISNLSQTVNSFDTRITECEDMVAEQTSLYARINLQVAQQNKNISALTGRVSTIESIIAAGGGGSALTEIDGGTY